MKDQPPVSLPFPEKFAIALRDFLHDEGSRCTIRFPGERIERTEAGYVTADLWRHFVELQKHHESLRQLTAQKSENDSVKLEFEKLEASAKIWKLTGPLMVLQETDEAKANVDKRIDFISKELEKVESMIKKTESEFESKRQDLIQIQTQLQSVAPVAN